MPEPVNTYRYLSYLGTRWRFSAVSCVVAVSLAAAVSLIRTKQYTATCRILIEPPASTDIRSALGVSPVYLESLKTYEHFASSDSLFARALDQFHLRRRFPGRHIESLKATMLKVGMVRETKILEIKVTLPDPRIAHELAKYLAAETVKLSQAVEQQGDQALLQASRNEEADARARLDRSEAAWRRAVSEYPIEKLEQDMRSGGDLKSSLARQLARAEVDASDPQADEAAAARANAEVLRRQLAQVERDLTAQQELLARRLAERDRISTERSASQETYAQVQARLDRARNDLGYHGERLAIIDPGVVPERPSGPNVPLAVLAALLLGLLAPVIYLTLELSYRTQRATVAPVAAYARPLRATGTGRDE